MIRSQDRFEKLPEEALVDRPPATGQQGERTTASGATPAYLKEATKHKEQGNQLFAQQEWELAVEEYERGLSLLPSLRDSTLGSNDDDVADETAQVQQEAESVEQSKLENDPRMKTLRAVLRANVGAAELKRERWKEAVAVCTKALEDDPDYVKALNRRAIANERIATWTSFSAALDDWKKIQALPNVDSKLQKQSEKALRELPPQLEARKAAETAEMMGKLKEMGNSILGKFGLSTDNFKLTPNGQGGYGMEFKH